MLSPSNIIKYQIRFSLLLRFLSLIPLCLPLFFGSNLEFYRICSFISMQQHIIMIICVGLEILFNGNAKCEMRNANCKNQIWNEREFSECDAVNCKLCDGSCGHFWWWKTQIHICFSPMWDHQLSGIWYPYVLSKLHFKASMRTWQ